jgi:NADPH:quinone reductase-like Zn-dependent oxidoreductase
MKAWEIRDGRGLDALALTERQAPTPGPGEVLVRLRASSLNYRDLSTVLDPLSRGLSLPLIPNSDAAGEVVEAGPGVTRFKPGDRVMGLFFQRWTAGAISAEAMASALGGGLDGVLCEQAVLREDGLVLLPRHLSFEEGATLPCAALTAWHALVTKGAVKAGDTVLLLGTGGVSLFALQFAKLHGARVIITSSSEEKLERARALGADETINYRRTPVWAEAVREATSGLGVDHVIELGGPGTLEQSIQATRLGGRISLIGILTGTAGAINPTAIMRASICLQGIYVGSREICAAMTRAIELHELKPVIDRVFDFAEARAAFQHMQTAAHFGKIVVRI